jgi:hypothetical protein
MVVCLYVWSSNIEIGQNCRDADVEHTVAICSCFISKKAAIFTEKPNHMTKRETSTCSVKSTSKVEANYMIQHHPCKYDFLKHNAFLK